MTQQNQRSWNEVRPGQFHCVIVQCSWRGCEEWMVSSPNTLYCEFHAVVAMRRAQARWREKNKKPYVPTGKVSDFTYEQIMEMRDLFLKWPAKQVADYFDCSDKTVYKYQKRMPRNLRRV